MKPTKSNTLPARLRAWRGDLSRSQAAEILRVPVRTLQDWEQGRRRPRGLAMQALNERLNDAP